MDGTLFCVFPGVQSERLVQSSDPVLIKPGTSHKLSCAYTISGYYMHWVRETSDRRLQYIGWISPDGSATFYHDSVKGRFTFSRDNSNNMAYLQMTDVKYEDTARYHCAGDSHRYKTMSECDINW
ncbi:hypothetical protein GDO78_014207 [Eleutherodactylus coqui]|uniref:Ig-like domain-containing protein n=1 Tax=Eleutherodactylus coqui TaxID=57060 RepID=A0A8J6BGY6_ELECQ|nr:hypothetical protein GDO78_014207 [Eleutherodactylus coqui]